MRPQPPTIPGWHLHLDEGLLVARRAVGLTAYMRQWGALSEVSARDYGELTVICDAQTRLAERLATAEWLQPRVIEMDAERA